MDDNDTLNILFVSAECVPFCANGGVADMCFALSKYLSRYDETDVRVVLPMYSTIPDEYKSKFVLVGERTVELTWRKEYCGVYEYEENNITYYFIDNKRYFDRPNLFGYDDDVERFSFFSKAVLDILPIINFFPDIIHTHDWQSSMVCTFLKVLEWQNPKYEHIKTVLNIHNLNYQGVADFKVVVDMLGIDEKFAYLFDFFGQANIMKASILCADQIVAVSETYKDEILNTDHGNGLQEVLKQSSHKLTGIINGIDYEIYDTMTDPNLYVPYNQKSVDKRAQNKLKLQEELGLPVNLDTPLYCYVGYMATHKGLDLLSGVLPKLVGEKGAQFVAIGKSTDECQRMMSELAATYPQNVKVIFAHDTNFVRKIYAGADFLFNVSSIEPCGLCPLIANRYGTLPIIYHTGGLKDNFTDFKYSNGNGYVLRNYDQNSLMDLIDRTLYDYENKEKIKGYILSGMNQDFDVKTCAEKYLKLYKEM